MRWDRTISLALSALGRPLGPDSAGPTTAADARLPILMYHSISDRDESRVNEYFRLCTPPSVFRQQLETLKANGWVGLDLESGLNQLKNPVAGGRRPVVITFDDGFRDFYTDALPILAEFGFTATMYLATGYLGDGRRAFNGTECLTWPEVREARVRGMHFGTHTVSHAKLHGMPWPQIESELRDSRAELELQIEASATAFAYPYAFPETDQSYCARLRSLLVEAGYRSCVTTILGRAAPGDDPFSLCRLPVNGADDASLLLAKLTGAYDWLRVPQRAAKQLKRLVGARGRA